jgi:hypothetical protein
MNSVYQVSVWYDPPVEPFGRVVHLSFKTHDRQARHDWREMQRIKNELVGEETEAIELFPAESRVMDTSNQYHLYCFPDFKIPLGVKERLIANEGGEGARQREFRPEFEPDDIVTPMQLLKEREAIESGQKVTSSRCPFPDCHSALVFEGAIEAKHEGGNTATVSRLHCLNGHTLFVGKTEDITKAETNGPEVAAESAEGDGSSTGGDAGGVPG